MSFDHTKHFHKTSGSVHRLVVLSVLLAGADLFAVGIVAAEPAFPDQASSSAAQPYDDWNWNKKQAEDYWSWLKDESGQAASGVEEAVANSEAFVQQKEKKLVYHIHRFPSFYEFVENVSSFVDQKQEETVEKLKKWIVAKLKEIRRHLDRIAEQ